MTTEQIRNELHRLNKLYIAKLKERDMARVPALREELSQQLEDIDSQICGLTQLIAMDAI
jgi:hypothetical protein